MKTTIKYNNDEFFVIPLKHVNRPETAKLCAITHVNGHKMVKRRVFGYNSKTRKSINCGQYLMKTAIKCKNGEFLVIPLKHVNRTGTPKLWAITHENGHKMQKRRVFGRNSETCKSP